MTMAVMTTPPVLMGMVRTHVIVLKASLEMDSIVQVSFLRL